MIFINFILLINLLILIWLQKSVKILNFIEYLYKIDILKKKYLVTKNINIFEITGELPIFTGF